MTELDRLRDAVVEAAVELDALFNSGSPYLSDARNKLHQAILAHRKASRQTARCVSAAPTGCVSDSECAAAGQCLEQSNATPPPRATPPAANAAQKAAYAAMPVAERLAIQSDLVWAGDLVGGLDPEFGDRAIAAVRSFQRRNKYEDNGILTPEQRQTLSGAMRTRKEYNGWRIVEDAMNPGVRLGIPSKLVPVTEAGATGSRWTAARGEIQIETFREKMAGATLQELFEEMKKRPLNRRLEHNAINTHSFALSGMQGLKKFHVRVFLKDNEARGLTILFDQAMETIMLPMVDAAEANWLSRTTALRSVVRSVLD